MGGDTCCGSAATFCARAGTFYARAGKTREAIGKTISFDNDLRVILVTMIVLL
jgi:hypothetical protein